MQSRRLWASLCVSVVMAAAVLTGLYSTTVEPTLTNVVTVTRTTETSETLTFHYTRTSTSARTVGTTTRYITTWSFGPCSSNYNYKFYERIALVRYNEEWDVIATLALQNVCILWNEGGKGNVMQTYHYPKSYRVTLTGTAFSLSYTILTSTSLSRSLVQFPVTVTESQYETVPNPQEFNLQLLAVLLFIAGLGGIAVAIVVRRPLPKI